MNVLVFRSNEELNEAAAGLFVSALQTNPRAVLGLATGSTPIGIYAQLVESYRSGKVSFAGPTTFNLDEYVGLGQNHPQSYRHFMDHHLFRHIDLPDENAHIPDGTAPDMVQEASRYDALLAKHPIDLQLLGLGHNGHIGFNEPGQELVACTHIVRLDERTRQANARFFDSSAEVPSHAITMGIAGILKAETILLVARGADKAEVVYRALRGPITTECPASLLQTHPQLIVMLDAEAARLLA